MAEEKEGQEYQTVHEEQGQEAAEGPTSAQNEEEVWTDYIDEGEESSSEGNEEAGEEEASPATSEGEEQEEAPAEEEPSQQDEGEGEEEPEQAEEEPEDVSQKYQETRQQVVDNVSKQFQLNDEQVDQLLEDPNKVLPSLMGELYTQVFETVLQTFEQNLPQMLERVEGQKQAQQRAEEEFYNQWPNLRGHEDTVERIALVYSQTNPNVNREQFIKDVGAQASIAAGAPPQGTEDPAQQQAPHQPAAPGGRGAAPSGEHQRRQPTNEYEEMAEEEINER